MVLGAYLILDQLVLYNSDYSDDSALRISGTIYSDVNKTTAFNLTGYTLTLRLHKENTRSDRLNDTLTINVAASGTFYLNVVQHSLPSAGLYLAKVELSKSGSVISTLNRVEVLIKRGPTA